MKLQTMILLCGAKSEFKITTEFTEPHYGYVTVTVANKAKPNQTIDVVTTSVREYSYTYSVGAISVKSKSGKSIDVRVVASDHWSFVMPNDDVIVTLTEIREQDLCLSADSLITDANNQQVRFCDLKPTDHVKVWDFDNGRFVTARLLWMIPVRTADHYYHVTFESGRTVGDYCIYNDVAAKKVHLFEGLGNKAWNCGAPGSTYFNYEHIPYDLSAFKRWIAPTAKYIRSIETY